MAGKPLVGKNAFVKCFNDRTREMPFYHVQRGSAKHSVKGGLAFLWEMRFSTPLLLSPQ